MAWLAVHPDATEKLRIPEDGPEFEFGFWPPLPDIEIRAKLPVLAKPDVDPTQDPDGFVKQSGLSWDLVRLVARWGVRGWKQEDGGIAAKVEDVEVDGRRHKVLSQESIEVLHRSGLLAAVALHSIVVNLLTEEKKREFEKQLASGSPSPSTPAPDVRPASHGSTTDPSHGETTPASGSSSVPTK